MCRRDPSQKSRFVRVLLSMLQSPSAAVSYEAAWTLVSLSGAPTAIRAVGLVCDGICVSTLAAAAGPRGVHVGRCAARHLPSLLLLVFLFVVGVRVRVRVWFRVARIPCP